MRLPLPRIAPAPPALIATHSTIYLAAVSEIRCIQNNLRGDASPLGLHAIAAVIPTVLLGLQQIPSEDNVLLLKLIFCFMVCAHITHQAKCTVPVSVLMLNWAKINDINK